MESIKIKISRLTWLIICATLLACGGQSEKNEIKQENKRVLKQYELVDLAEFKALLEQETNPQLIDVRTPEEFEQGAIEGAVNYNYLTAVFQSKVPLIDKNRPVFLYCASGGRSRMAADYLKAEGGFTSIIDLKGGYANWENQ